MAREVESKWKISAAEPLRAKLAAIGGVHIGACLERNLIYDTQDQRLFKADCGLRLRIERPLAVDSGKRRDDNERATLTYKGPRAVDSHGTKARDEFESEVSDADAVARLLEALGYKPQIVFEKRRESWRAPNAVVTLDEMPSIGWFVEIEAADGASVAALARRLDLQGPPTEETYVSLAAQHGVRDSSQVTTLRFASS